jgi:glycerophosphoryl diester phosphodiesterase
LDLAANAAVDGPLLRQVRAAGLKLFVWTVDDPAPARRLTALGVDGITTNRPALLRGPAAP